VKYIFTRLMLTMHDSGAMLLNVRSVTHTSSAISLLISPAIIHRKTSNSRGVSSASRAWLATTAAEHVSARATAQTGPGYGVRARSVLVAAERRHGAVRPGVHVRAVFGRIHDEGVVVSAQ
jgi:hypothetical protein